MIINTYLLCVFFLVSLATADVFDPLFRSTGYNCAGDKVTLSCDNDNIIIINKIVSRISLNNNDCSVNDDDINNDIDYKSEYEYDYKEKCNGKKTCELKLTKYKHLIGQYRANANFESNRVNIYYSCIPRAVKPSIKSFCICTYGKTITDVYEGFIHSPNYPNYYGNNRNCKIDISLPSDDYRLVAYLVSMNIEKKGWLSHVPKDYLYMQNNDELYYGSLQPKLLLFENKLTTFKFRTDLVTLARLSDPKGFLIYFKVIKVNTPTTTTTTTTITRAPEIVTEINSLLTTKFILPVVDLTTSLSIATSKISVENDRLFASLLANTNEKLIHNSQKLPEDRTAFLVCTIVGLCGLIVILSTTVLLLLRRRKYGKYRRQAQYPPSEDYSNYSIIDKIKYLYNNNNNSFKKNSIKETLETTKVSITSKVDLNETKTEIIDETKKNDESLKFENIYVKSPVLDKKFDDEEVYHTIIEESPVVSICEEGLNYAEITNVNENSNNNSIQNINEKIIYDELKPNELNIYSTPTNKEISVDDRKIFFDDLNKSSVSSTNLLP